MDDERLRLLQDMPIFGALSEATLEFLLERAAVVEVDAGDLFFREGEQENTAYVLEAGAGSVWKRHGERQHRLSVLGPGDCFGEVALMDFGPRSASVRADEPSRALVLSAGDLRALFARDAEQFALVYMNMARELSRRLRVADERLFRARIDSEPLAEGYSFATL